jgi:hypothetical protein
MEGAVLAREGGGGDHGVLVGLIMKEGSHAGGAATRSRPRIEARGVGEGFSDSGQAGSCATGFSGARSRTPLPAP